MSDITDKHFNFKTEKACGKTNESQFFIYEHTLISFRQMLIFKNAQLLLNEEQFIHSNKKCPSLLLNGRPAL